jgi:hypothetical protein
LGEGGFKGRRPSLREDYSKRVKVHTKYLKIFSRTRGPISFKLSANYPWIKGIQVSSNNGPGPFQRGDNHKNVKVG